MDLLAGFEHFVRENELLAGYTRLRLGGPAEYFAEPTTYDELAALVKRFYEAEISIRLLGSGTNILVRDEGVPGLVIHLSAPAFAKLEVKGDRVVAGGGVKLANFISFAIGEGFSGPENLVGVPGTVGGAVHNNASTHNGDIGQSVREATVLLRTGEVKTRQAGEISFAYRQSSLNELVILDATFEFERGNPSDITRRMQKLWIVKAASQPNPSEAAAYVFKDPVGVTASSLIEQAGLKGTKMGGVELYDKDPNFFVAQPKAKYEDVVRLIELVKSRVFETTGIELATNLQIW